MTLLKYNTHEKKVPCSNVYILTTKMESIMIFLMPIFSMLWLRWGKIVQICIFHVRKQRECLWGKKKKYKKLIATYNQKRELEKWKRRFHFHCMFTFCTLSKSHHVYYPKYLHKNFKIYCFEKITLPKSELRFYHSEIR